jgi:hypothetical protein
MTVIEATDNYPMFLPQPKTPRSPGVHVSSIIRCIATEAGILKPEWAEELSLVDARTITDPVAILRISIGLAIEQYYIPEILSHYGVLDHPGELHYDGVYMTHDGESESVIITLNERGKNHVGVYQRVHEVKATYKSTRTVGDLSSQWMWLAQMKAYCIAKGTRFAVMHCWFLCGDYKYPIKPIRLVWEIEFTQDELDNNWNLLADYKREFEVLMVMEADLLRRQEGRYE